MKQLALDFAPDQAPSLDSFVAGDDSANALMLATLRDIVRPGARDHVYLWGETGCGRTHLLRACVEAARAAGRPALYLAASAAGEVLPEAPGQLLAVDDVDALPPEAQIALFNAYNRSRGSGQSLVLAGTAAPLGLALREDLRTRLGQCLVFQVHPLDDQARNAILATLAQRRGLRLDQEVIAYLLRHGRRDLPSLVAVLDALDRTSLERKRPVTLPLLRELLQGGLEI